MGVGLMVRNIRSGGDLAKSDRENIASEERT